MNYVGGAKHKQYEKYHGCGTLYFMTMFEHEGIRSPNYPKDETYISLDATDYGMLQASFEFALMDHGNDLSATWPCYAGDEQFSVSYEGQGATMLEGRYWGIWLVSFEKLNKVLRVDVGRNSVERFDTSAFVEASNRDISDLIAASFNLDEYNYQHRMQGSTILRMLPLNLSIEPVELDSDPEQ